MQIVVIDGQGGGMGRSIVERLKETLPEAEIVAVGTNALATSNMMKGGANAGATGENAVAYNCARADVIVGPLGIILPNAMYGEVTPKMAVAVSGCSADRVFLIPAVKKHVHIIGIQEKTISQYIDEAIDEIKKHCGSRPSNR
ncbi:DUF3842 family protein [Caproiciproducens faecalis]|uniref:DUF3842 family protein n=1 Tax=Caproiciproducens faecalis TaxID=2820301 RepID=A0ABS7DLR6_9FIRM|nr:DUF3842 family protein [Caproiciproducens faecalis]MBW7572263.1 DUF3842 family protein [Caproiciproducens faecalis]